MKLIKGAALCLAVVVAILLVACSSNKEAKTPGLEEAVSTAIDAYLYGYPLITFDVARMQQTNVPVPDAEHAPMGQMIRMRTYPAVDNHCCAAPNADTLYTEAWLDVSKEPSILSIPDMGNRYYIIPMLDGYSEVFSVASPATSGYKAQTYAITGPGWTGTLPPGVTQVKSATGMVWVLGRVYCTGTTEDYKAVHALQDKFSVVPLSSYGKRYAPPPALVDPNFDMKTAVRKQVDGLDIEAYFTRLAQLMKTNPPTAADAPLVARMARIGLVPGQDYDPSKLGAFDKEAIKAVPKLALLKMVKLLKEQKTTNGWLYFTSGVGNWGTDYPLRAMANMLGPGWNRPQDAIYPLSQKDASDDGYNGSDHRYVIHFDKGQFPPVKAFWSITLYDPDFFFVPNSINRCELSQRNKFITNPDGSVDMYLQAQSPGKAKEANWLPAPKGKFSLVMRMYWPTATAPSIVDGTWTPPGAKRVD
jgi:hypothetical protein